VGGNAPTEAVGSPRVELRLAGTFAVVRDGSELPDGQVGSRKSRTLLKLLAVERPALVPVDRIVGVLWQARPPAGAERNVAALVSRLRRVLGTGVIQGGRQAYRLADGPAVRVDLDVAARYCDHAERQVRAAAAVALTAAERALGLTPAAALELCEVALGARLLVISGRDYEFANDLIREALYASIPEPARLAYHRRAADLLTGQPEPLARHAAAAGCWPAAGPRRSACSSAAWRRPRRPGWRTACCAARRRWPRPPARRPC
jgi:hypothetical protein